MDILTSVYSIFALEPLQYFHLVMTKVLKKCTVIYLESDILYIHPRNPAHEKRPFSKMQTSILRVVDPLLAAMKQDLSLSGL